VVTRFSSALILSCALQGTTLALPFSYHLLSEGDQQRGGAEMPKVEVAGRDGQSPSVYLANSDDVDKIDNLIHIFAVAVSCPKKC